LVLSLSAAPALAGTISSVGIYSFSSEFARDGWDLRATHLVDGSGLAGGSHGSCWVTNTCWQNDPAVDGAFPVSVTFDLGAVYLLGSIHVWNGYWADEESGRGANSVEILTSFDAGAWDNRGTFSFPMAPATLGEYTGFEIPGLNWAGTRYVQFNILSIHGSSTCGTCASLSEVRFSDVPEPGTLLLIGCGLMTLAVLRRR
jgi:hypothetical protein